MYCMCTHGCQCSGWRLRLKWKHWLYSRMDWNENHSRTGTDLTDLNKAEKVGIRLIRKGGGGAASQDWSLAQVMRGARRPPQVSQTKHLLRNFNNELNGLFTEFTKILSRNVYRVPPSLNTERAPVTTTRIFRLPNWTNMDRLALCVKRPILKPLVVTSDDANVMQTIGDGVCERILGLSSKPDLLVSWNAVQVARIRLHVAAQHICHGEEHGLAAGQRFDLRMVDGRSCGKRVWLGMGKCGYVCMFSVWVCSIPKSQTTGQRLHTTMGPLSRSCGPLALHEKALPRGAWQSAGL